VITRDFERIRAEAVKNIVEIAVKLGPMDKSVLRYKESEGSGVGS
jgi:hypothetical protein